jgi:hypothetical protein
MEHCPDCSQIVVVRKFLFFKLTRSHGQVVLCRRHRATEELLAALSRLLRWHESQLIEGSMEADCWENARAVIRRATP